MAIGPEDHAAAADLIRQYVASLAFELDFQDVDAELADLAASYGGGSGALFLAVADEPGSAEPVGVVGVRMIGDGMAELKRMYLRPEGRGRGLGRTLAEHAIAAARRLGAARIVLDTDQASMAEANTLYESLGFVDIDRYRENPLACARFMGLDLVAGTAPAVGVVLAGGSSSRMGLDKPGLAVAGRPMIDHVVTALAEAGVERVVVSGRLVKGLDGVPDPPGLAGPVAGLLAAFRRLPGRDEPRGRRGHRAPQAAGGLSRPGQGGGHGACGGRPARPFLGPVGHAAGHGAERPVFPPRDPIPGGRPGGGAEGTAWGPGEKLSPVDRAGRSQLQLFVWPGGRARCA
jgi:GNAT superfamily N-acetyltransferase